MNQLITLDFLPHALRSSPPKVGYGMDHRRPIIHSIDQAETMHARLLEGAAATAKFLREFSGEPMALLKALRFELVGHDPLTGEPLNVVEQLNQTFTILVTLRAIERLIELHPDAGGFKLALGTSSGRDIESVVPDFVAAEVFSATKPTSNRKLKKDIARLSTDPARYRYVFFASPGFLPGRQDKLELKTAPGVHVYVVEP
jgi:hypothetical protein